MLLSVCVNFSDETLAAKGLKGESKATDRCQPGKSAGGGAQGTEMLGITAKKMDQFSDWYSQIILRADMVEYYDVSGCYILR